MSYIHDVYSSMVDDDVLRYVNYRNIEQSDKEFIRNDFWDLEFVTSPIATYFPGNDLLKARLKTFSYTTEEGISEMTSTIRGFKVRQSTQSGTTSGTLTLEYTDREDQAVSLFHEDWKQKIGSRRTRFAYRKLDTICDIKATWFNTPRTPIREVYFYSCQLTNNPNPWTVSSEDAGNDNGEISMELAFEHHEVKFLLSDATLNM